VSDAPRRSRGGAVPFRVVGFGLGVLAAIALVIGLGAYFELLRYRRVAAHHVPADTAIAVRIDVEQVVLYEPVRKYLIPLIDAIEPHGTGRVDRLRRQGGINLGLELREVVVAVGPTAHDWVVVVGGLFDDRVLDRVEAVLRKEGTSVTEEAGVSMFGREIVAARADDGALVFGPSLECVRRALPEQPTYGRLGLVDSGPGSFAITRLPLPDLEGWDTAAVDGRRVRALGSLTLGPEMAVSVHVDFEGSRPDTDASRFAAELEGSRDALRRFAAAKGPIRITSVGSRVDLSIPLDVDSLDRSAAALASELRHWLVSQHERR
jgi:hypothetical protein